MNFYGFRKINFDDARNKLKRAVTTDFGAGEMGADGKCWEFCHPSFIRGRQDLLRNIKRKTYADAAVASKDELDMLRGEVEQRTLEIESNESRMMRLEKICESLQAEVMELKKSYGSRGRETNPILASSSTSATFSFGSGVHPSSILDNNHDLDQDITWKFDEPFDFQFNDPILNLDDSVFDTESSHVMDDFSEKIISPTDSFDAIMNEYVTSTELTEVEAKVPLIEDKEPRAALQATLASLPTQIHQKEFLVKLVNTIREMFPEVGAMFKDGKDKTKLRSLVVSSSLASPPLSRSNSNSALTTTLSASTANPSPAQIELAQQQAMSMMATLLPSIQIALLNVVAASAMTSVSMSSMKGDAGNVL